MKIARGRGYKCLGAGDGKSGLLLATEQDVTAIILDLGLPDIDGMRVLDQLKDNLKTRHIPVHIITADDGPGDAGAAQERGDRLPHQAGGYRGYRRRVHAHRGPAALGRQEGAGGGGRRKHANRPPEPAQAEERRDHRDRNGRCGAEADTGNHVRLRHSRPQAAGHDRLRMAAGGGEGGRRRRRAAHHHLHRERPLRGGEPAAFTLYRAASSSRARSLRSGCSTR